MMDCLNMMGPMGWTMGFLWVLLFGLVIWEL